MIQPSGDALVWTGQFQVEVFNAETIILPVMPSSVTLSDIRIDGEPATVLVEGSHFATVLQGRGMHRAEVAFQIPVIGDEGPPRARLQIPMIPVSRFELLLPGKKEVKVDPGADVVATEIDGTTIATTYIPMSNSVVFTWTEAIPEDLRGQLRANASLFHTVHADEGVLHVQGTVVYEITHGETNLLELEIPDAAQVNRIVAPAGGCRIGWSRPRRARGEKRSISFSSDRLRASMSWRYHTSACWAPARVRWTRLPSPC